MSVDTPENILARWPKGWAWDPKPDDDLDKLLQVMEDIEDGVIEDGQALADIMDPQKTNQLSDLEKEYGILPLDSATEQERRDDVQAQKTSRGGSGAWDYIQAKLRESGFTDVYVHPNDPAVDPNIFLDQAFQMVANGANAFAGRDDAFAGRVGGELLVNGDLFTQRPKYTMVCGGSFASAGNDDALCGRFDELERIPIEYKVPTNPGYWPLFGFFGGPAIRDGSGYIISIEPVEISINRRSKFRELILKYKPAHSWAALIVNYV
jgi:hypothetical protein